MQIDDFWNLIEKNRAKYGDDFDGLIDAITDDVIGRSEQEIIDFECRLRELLLKSYHFDVMAIQKIIQGFVTDDSFLYFRCGLILYGRNVFENAISAADDFSKQVDSMLDGESLLYVADKAFMSKFGKETDKTLPRDYAREIIDYDGGDDSVEGEDWNEEDLPRRYPKLWKIYH